VNVLYSVGIIYYFAILGIFQVRSHSFAIYEIMVDALNGTGMMDHVKPL